MVVILSLVAVVVVLLGCKFNSRSTLVEPTWIVGVLAMTIFSFLYNGSNIHLCIVSFLRLWHVICRGLAAISSKLSNH